MRIRNFFIWNGASSWIFCRRIFWRLSPIAVFNVVVVVDVVVCRQLELVGGPRLVVHHEDDRQDGVERHPVPVVSGLGWRLRSPVQARAHFRAVALQRQADQARQPRTPFGRAYRLVKSPDITLGLLVTDTKCPLPFFKHLERLVPSSNIDVIS